MNAIYELKEMLCDELEQLMQRGSNINIDLVDKLTHSLKSVETIIAMHEGGYSTHVMYDDSNDYNSYRGNSYGNQRYNSYGRNGVRMNRRFTGYSRDNGKEDMIESLHNMLNEASTDKEKNAIHQCIEKLQNN